MAKQRKPNRKPKIFRKEKVRAQDIAGLGSLCAWDGCIATFEKMMPPDWRMLLVYWSPLPEGDKTLLEIALGGNCDRDASLCPEHARELDGLLKDIGRLVDAPPAGTA